MAKSWKRPKGKIMELEVTFSPQNSPVHEVRTKSSEKKGPQKVIPTQQNSEKSRENAAIRAANVTQSEYTREEIELYLKKFFSNHTPLNKRLRFSVNKELNQVVVKIIDSTTDKVIKEIPPKELQKLHVRVREAIGLLIDEEI